MEAKKLGMIAAAALTVLAAQANAGDNKAKKAATTQPAATTSEMCLSAKCGSAGCANKSELKTTDDKKVADAAACKKLGGKWGKPVTAAATHKH